MNVPKLRFKEFDGEWEEKKLEEISEKLTRKNKELKVTNVISNSASQGLVSQRAYFEKDIANKDNIDGYYIISKGDFVYNPRISKEAPYGPISIYHDNEDGIVSPLYTCFRILKESAFPIYIYYFFKSTSWHKYIYKNGDSGARHDRVSIKDATFFKLPVKLSTLEEQKKIGTFFEVMDKKIQLQQQKIDLLQEQKKGFLQKMFPKAGETQPEMRFEGFTGDWEERKLKEVGEINTGNTPSTTDKSNYAEQGTLWVTPTDIKYLITTETSKKLSVKGEKIARIVPGGTILVTCIASIGKNTMILNKSGFNQQINSLTPNHNNDSYFLLTQSEFWSRKMKNIAASGTMQIVNKNEFSNLLFAYPILEEQQRLGAFFKKLDDAINLQKQKLDLLQKQKQSFMQQMFI